MIDIRQVAVAALVCGLIGDLSAADKIKINVRQSDAAIRQQLLRFTPPGTSAEQVFQVLQSRLQRERGSLVGAPGQPYRSTMRVVLDHYHDPRTISEYLFPFPTIVGATWKFDGRDRLRDVQVRRGLDAL
jgi:hypothetical protein